MLQEYRELNFLGEEITESGVDGGIGGHHRIGQFADVAGGDVELVFRSDLQRRAQGDPAFGIIAEQGTARHRGGAGFIVQVLAQLHPAGVELPVLGYPITSPRLDAIGVAYEVVLELAAEAAGAGIETAQDNILLIKSGDRKS